MITHGKASTYNNHKCRCEACRAAWAAYLRPRIKQYRGTHPRTTIYKTKTLNNKKTRKEDRYKILLEKQRGVCAICERAPENYLDEDHNHRTGQIRGLLCRSCNTALGKLGDSPARLRRAAYYLENPPAKHVTIHL
jgi:hypothetical protein